MGFGPEFLVAVFVMVGDLLHGGPAEEGIVAYERRDITHGDGKANGSVDEVGEEGDSVGC